MDGLRVEHDLRDLVADLKAAGDDALVKELLAALKAAAKPIVPGTRAVALAKLPAGGGLAKKVARSPQRVTARAGRTTATVGVVLSGKKKGTGATQADSGTIRHPVFNRVGADGKRIFVSQKVPPRWFSDTAEQIAQDGAASEVLKAMDNVARKAGFR